MTCLALTASVLAFGSNAHAQLTDADEQPLDVSCQVNGVVNDILIVGNAYYFGGSFDRVRPFGTMAGDAVEVVRNNVAACDVGTGEILPWNPDANGPVRALEWDGAHIYLGGETFSAVGGQDHNNLARVNLSDGAVDAGFVFDTNKGVREILYDAATDRVYVGGRFWQVNGKYNDRLVRIKNVSTSPSRDGSFRPRFSTNQNPGGGRDVQAMLLVGNDLYVGGMFSAINAVPRNSSGAIDTTTGATTRPFAPQIRDDHAFQEARVFDIVEYSGEIVMCGDWWNQFDHTTNTWLGPSVGPNPGGQWNMGRYDPATGAHTDLGWHAFTDGGVQACAVDETAGVLYAGGYFATVNGASQKRIYAIRFSDGSLTDWRAEANGAPGVNVVRMVGGGGVIYGGNFGQVNGIQQQGLAVFGVADTMPDDSPTTPGSFQALVAGSDVELGWQASTGDAPIAGYRIFRDGLEIGSNPATTEDFNVVGDLARCSSADTTARHTAVANLLATYPGSVGLTGDLAYPDGTPAEFADCYAPAWSQLDDRAYPIPGNHDYKTAGAAGYFGYWGMQAGDPSEGWYSFDVGSWKVYALNSNRNCTDVACWLGSEQHQWFEQELQRTTVQCSMMMVHHPRWSSNKHGNAAAVGALYDLAYDYGVDLVIASHDHGYERFPRLDGGGNPDPSGPMSFVIGTGGASMYSFALAPENALPPSVVKQDTSYGFGHFSLAPTSFSWEFVTALGPAFTDTGGDSCVGPTLASLTFTDPDLADGTYEYEIEAYDATGLVSARAQRTVMVGGHVGAPIGVFSAPAALSTVTGPVVEISGTAIAEDVVDGVFVAIKDKDAGQWYQGDGTWGGFKRLSTTLASPGANETAWSAEFDLPPARYQTWLVVMDGTGRRNPTPRPTLRFDVAD